MGRNQTSQKSRLMGRTIPKPNRRYIDEEANRQVTGSQKSKNIPKLSPVVCPGIAAPSMTPAFTRSNSPSNPRL